MKVTNEKTENSQAFLTIEMEPAEVDESLEKAYRRLVQRAKVPGFRKGKAPRAILERYIGKDGLLEEELNILAPQACEQAIKEQAIEAIAQPQIEVAQTEPVVFKAIVPLKPGVTLGDYQHIELTPEPVEVTDNDISAVLEQLRHQHATWEPVERPVDFGDLVVIDVESSVEDKPLLNRQGVQYQVLRDLSFPAPGFSQQLVGMKKNEEKEFKLQFPSDYSRNELAGKETWFKVRVTETKQELVPELNDELAKEVNPDFPTLDSLREQVSAELKLRAEQRVRADFEERVVDAAVDLAQVEFPPVMVEAEIHRILNQRFQRGNQELEEYLRNFNKTEEELHEELHPLAAKRIARSLVLGRVAEEEKIEVSSSEIDTEIENMIKSTAEQKDELKKVLDTPQARQSIEQTLITRKTVERLVEIAQGSKENTVDKKEEEK